VVALVTVLITERRRDVSEPPLPDGRCSLATSVGVERRRGEMGRALESAIALRKPRQNGRTGSDWKPQVAFVLLVVLVVGTPASRR